MSTDAELLHHYAESHSEEAFAELVRRHLTFVYGTALRRMNGDTHRAEEIAQSVFTDLARKATKLSRHPTLNGWLHTSTRYAAAALIRSEQRRQTREQEAMAMPDASSHSTPTIDWEQIRPVIDEALDQLDERDRAAVLLRFFENQPLAQVGATLVLSEDAARKRIDRALEKLRRLLARRGIASTSTALGLALANQVAVAAPASLAASITSTIFAGTAAASSSSLFSLFAMTKLQSGTLAALIVALAATAGSVSLGVVVSRQQAELSAAPTLASAQADADNHQLAALRTKLATAENARDAIRAELKKLTDKKAKRAREEEDALHGPAGMLSRRLYFQRQFRPFFEQMKLDEATRQKFIAIKIEDDVAELASTLHARKTTGDDDAPMEKREDIWARTDENIRQLLGPQGHATYREYMACSVSFKEIGYALADAACALTDEDHAWLGHEWYSVVVQPNEDIPTKNLPEPTDLLPSEQALLARAAGRLTPQQVAVLRKYMDDEHTYLKVLRSSRK